MRNSSTLLIGNGGSGLELQWSLSPPLLSRRSSQPRSLRPANSHQPLEFSPFSEIDFRLGDHQHLKGYFLDNLRDRLLR